MNSINDYDHSVESAAEAFEWVNNFPDLFHRLQEIEKEWDLVQFMQAYLQGCEMDEMELWPEHIRKRFAVKGPNSLTHFWDVLGPSPFCIRRNTWGNTLALVKDVRPPLKKSKKPVVVMDVYSTKTGKILTPDFVPSMPSHPEWLFAVTPDFVDLNRPIGELTTSFKA